MLAGGSACGRGDDRRAEQTVDAATPEGWQLGHRTSSTTTSTTSRSARSTRRSGRSPTARRPTSPGPSPPAPGLWGNHGYEADYELVWVDADGEPLNGAHRYELRLETPPPVDAFWSLTMYDVPDFYLVDNPIDRYSIGDRTPGLQSRRRRLDHASTCSTESPGAGPEANWLPTPARPSARCCACTSRGSELLDGSYAMPAVRKLG